jgi:hypothetical protein
VNSTSSLGRLSLHGLGHCSWPRGISGLTFPLSTQLSGPLLNTGVISQSALPAAAAEQQDNRQFQYFVILSHIDRDRNIHSVMRITTLG